MKLSIVWAAAVFGIVSLLQAQTSIDLRTQAKNVDFSSAASTKPSKTGTLLPFTCSLGETFFKLQVCQERLYNRMGCLHKRQ